MLFAANVVVVVCCLLFWMLTLLMSPYANAWQQQPNQQSPNNN